MKAVVLEMTASQLKTSLHLWHSCSSLPRSRTLSQIFIPSLATLIDSVTRIVTPLTRNTTDFVFDRTVARMNWSESARPRMLSTTKNGTATKHRTFLIFDRRAIALSPVKNSSPTKRTLVTPTRAISAQCRTWGRRRYFDLCHGLSPPAPGMKIST